MARLLFATTNQGKLRELRALLGDAVEVASLKDLPPIPEPVEDGATFEENARLKAQAYARESGLWALADDSGLCVDALDGRPGVLSARYAPGDDAARVQKLLGELSGIPDERRGAAFRCALCLASPSGELVETAGEVRGVIASEPRGEHGFGYDPVFFIPERSRTMAELTTLEKSDLSHRGRAFAQIRPALLARLGR